jgi:dTDP-4-dehydrorhamnose reductase
MASDPYLVVGGDSDIGAGLVKALKTDNTAVSATSRRLDRPDGFVLLDLAQPAGSWHWPDETRTAIICAAMTSIDACEKSPDESEAVNVSAPSALVELLADQGVRSIVLSTSMVFDGTRVRPSAEHPVLPLTIYGRQKAALEKNLLALDGNHAVLRLTKVLTPDNPLLRGWVNELSAGRPVNAFEDMYFAPVSLEAAVAVILSVAENEQGGIFQYSACEDISYHAAARHLAHRLGVAPDLVRGSSWRDVGLDAARAPANTALDCASVMAIGGLWAPDAFDVLDQVIDEIVETAGAVQ